ncbi:MAG: TerC family protein [Armatimonadetes bacterium]|nr:TerC family protein [Armatimonadota bacterium]
MIIETVAVIGILILLEGLLSADNALVLAVLVRHLPEKQQHRALLYGIFGAFALRFLGILVAKYIIAFWYLRALGAAYLAYLCIAHFAGKTRHAREVRSREGMGFWPTVVVVELTDIAFAIDSILVAVALSNKLWVIYTGVMLGIIALRLVAGMFIALLRKYPALDHTAYVITGWVSVKLFINSYESYAATVLHSPFDHHLLPKSIFWAVMALIAVLGFAYAVRQKAKSKVSESISR